ncbi:histidine phosphatase superfamily [Dactylonectria estremocensis]|uniref:Histidine phosphatase superfamily n=1 Tax=Dactylonectria estremocensis TaxID=1079267 RepID=A0A9P9DZJ6_9HYPO|nr:histidine phosphatase superfamily [Dactylonectria estremocensis]
MSEARVESQPSLRSLRGSQLALCVVVSAAALFALSQYYRMISAPQSSLLTVLSATTAVLGAATVDLNWYPPSDSKINSLTSALESDGVYGFIFNSSKTANKEYGTYNWCNMPHARKREYVKASRDYELEYVEVIQRHHKRTPYASNAFPVEPYQWNCDNQGLYFFGRPFTQKGKSAAEAYWAGVPADGSDVNPFVPSGWIGSCQFPQITADGLDDSWTHGHDLYEVYHDLLGFLPGRNKNWRKKVQFRVTNNQITSQVAAMFINGMWDTTDSVPLIIQATGVDSLEPQYSCSVGSNLFSQIKSSANSAWQLHLTKSSALFKTLDDISGVPSTDSGFHASFDHYFDNLSGRQCHAKPLPCKLVDGKNSSTCVGQETANAVYRMGQWEYSQIYRDASSSLAASSTTYGVWIAELASHFRAVINGESSTLYLHNFAHDGSTSRLLSILQIDTMVWPGMGSEIVFELYKKKSRKPKDTSGYYVRVLFGGQTLKSSNPSLGLMEMVPVETLLAYFDGLAGKNASLVKGKCSGSISV